MQRGIRSPLIDERLLWLSLVAARLEVVVVSRVLLVQAILGPDARQVCRDHWVVQVVAATGTACSQVLLSCGRWVPQRVELA